MKPSQHFLKLFTVLLALTTAVPSQAASARDELLRLIPEDVGFCLVLQDLRGQSEALLGSDFVKQLRDSPIGLTLSQTPEVHKLAEADQHLQKFLGVSGEQIRADILGDAVVLAYRPGPPGQPDREQGLFLLKARNADLLAQIVSKVNASQKEAGQLKDLEVRRYGDMEYTCRVEQKEKNFYYLHGQIFAFSSSEDMVKAVLDRQRRALGKGEPLVARHLHRLEADKALLSLWMNPRAFDAELDHKIANLEGAGALVFKTFLVYWKALDGIGLTATLGKDTLEISLGILVQEERLPPAARKAFAGEVRPSELWSRFPEQALLTVADRVDAVTLTDFLAEFLPPEVRVSLEGAANRGTGALGKDVVKDVLPCLGPDWGFCILAPAPGVKLVLPQVIGALRVRPGNQAPPLDEALLNGINAFAMLGVLAYNGDHTDQISLKTATQDKVTVRYLVSDKLFAPGLQPAFALKDGYLLLASSPEAIRRFGAGPSTAPAAPAGGEVPLVRLSLKEIARFLEDKTHHEALAAHVADKHHISSEEAGHKVDNLLALCRLFDRLEWSRRAAPGGLALVVRVRTAQPLEK